MSVYYYLENNTKKEFIKVGDNIKCSDIIKNNVVQFAFINYMFEHKGDLFSIIDDTCIFDSEFMEYKTVDLLKYDFDDPSIKIKINKLLNNDYWVPIPKIPTIKDDSMHESIKDFIPPVAVNCVNTDKNAVVVQIMESGKRIIHIECCDVDMMPSLKKLTNRMMIAFR